LARAMPCHDLLRARGCLPRRAGSTALLVAAPTISAVVAAERSARAGHLIKAASCSRPDVQKAIDAAADGDVVVVPPGEATWRSPVLISEKGMTLQGAGEWLSVLGLAPTVDHGHQQSNAGVLQIANDRYAAKAAIQQQKAAFDTFPACLSEQSLDDFLHRLSTTYRRQGDREAMSLTDDMAAGVGMKMTCAVLGLAAADFPGVPIRLAVIGNQRQVDGHCLRATPEGLREAVGQGAIQSPRQLVILGQGGHQGFEQGLLREGMIQIAASGEDRGDLGNCKNRMCSKTEAWHL